MDQPLKPGNPVPRGIEVLVMKAAVDPEFKRVLLENREAAAAVIGLELTPAEVLMLRVIPGDQLEKTIAATTVPAEHRRTFLGCCAITMLAALGAVAYISSLGTTAGIRFEKVGTKFEPNPRPEPPQKE